MRIRYWVKYSIKLKFSIHVFWARVVERYLICFRIESWTLKQIFELSNSEQHQKESWYKVKQTCLPPLEKINNWLYHLNGRNRKLHSMRPFLVDDLTECTNTSQGDIFVSHNSMSTDLQTNHIYSRVWEA